jgi:uncharacterized protein (DUF2236 family)
MAASRNLIARKINREAVVLLGWGRAILLQLSHPLVAAGVAEYSHFDESAGGYVRRVRQTVGGMLGITFGSPEQAHRIIERINHIHRNVHGTLSKPAGIFPAGTPYSATDPRLLCWVHATLVESMTMTYERLVGPLTAGERDQFCAEAAETGSLLGIPDGFLPKTTTALAGYFDEMYASGAIAVSDDARSLAGALFSPPLGPAATPLCRVTRLVTVGLLPEHIRSDYGFKWDARRDQAFRAILGLIRRTRGVLPAVLREWPIARAA